MWPLKSRKTTVRRDRKSIRLVLLYGILFSSLLFLLSLVKPDLTDFLNNRVYDALLVSDTGEPSRVPVIVDIDEKSLKLYGQ